MSPPVPQAMAGIFTPCAAGAHPIQVERAAGALTARYNCIGPGSRAHTRDGVDVDSARGCARGRVREPSGPSGDVNVWGYKIVRLQYASRFKNQEFKLCSAAHI